MVVEGKNEFALFSFFTVTSVIDVFDCLIKFNQCNVVLT